MMSVYVINGEEYKAVLDEEPRVMGGGGDDYLINGTTRTLALLNHLAINQNLAMLSPHLMRNMSSVVLVLKMVRLYCSWSKCDV